MKINSKYRSHEIWIEIFLKITLVFKIFNFYKHTITNSSSYLQCWQIITSMHSWIFRLCTYVVNLFWYFIVEWYSVRNKNKVNINVYSCSLYKKKILTLLGQKHEEAIPIHSVALIFLPKVELPQFLLDVLKTLHCINLYISMTYQK